MAIKVEVLCTMAIGPSRNHQHRNATHRQDDVRCRINDERGKGDRHDAKTETDAL